MECVGQDQVRCEIIVDNKLLQVQNFKCLGCGISFENEKVATFFQILEILNNTFKPTLVQKSSGMKVHNVLTSPILLYGNEVWTLRQKDKKRFTSISMPQQE